MDNIWLGIVKDALENIIERTGIAVPGAKLRAAVANIANTRGLSFPPPNMGKFSSFVESFPTDFVVHRQPGQDILVVPASRPELLLSIDTPYNTSLNARIREDIFEALTRIPAPNTGKAFYIPETDSVVWVKSNEQAPASAIELPQASLQHEIEVRRRFATKPDLPEQAKKELTELEEEGFLRSFSNVVHSYGLVKQWHQFRLSTLSQQLREWSVNKTINWQQSWIDLAESKVVPVPIAFQSVSVDNKRLLREFAALLTDEDLSRISIPMDIVLRLMSTR